tara:strand:- start:1094 stop:1831 length:738 start_codon:yes stop_codon:yes gene_type:complete
MISISKRELFIQAFELFKGNAQFFINIGILLFVVQHMLPIMIGILFVPYSASYFIFHIGYLFITTTISLWAIAQMLKILRSQPTDSFQTLFIYFPKVLRAIGGSFVITFSLLMIGVILFSILGSQINLDWEIATLEMIGHAILNSTLLSVITLVYFIIATYLWIKTYFFIYYIIDQDLSLIESIKKSLHSTKGYEGDLFIVWVSTILMNFLGITFYGIGLMLTLPYTLIILSMFYAKYLCKIKEQ